MDIGIVVLEDLAVKVAVHDTAGGRNTVNDLYAFLHSDSFPEDGSLHFGFFPEVTALADYAPVRELN